MVQRKQRFATQGVRFQRHNPDGTIPTPQRFLGFANAADLSAMAGSPQPFTLKIDDRPHATLPVSIGGAADPSRVTVQEAADALNAAGFENFRFIADPFTGRLRGSYSTGKAATLTVELANEDDAAHTLPAGTYALQYGGKSFAAVLAAPLSIPDGETAQIVFTAASAGIAPSLPSAGEPVQMSALTPNVNVMIVGTFAGSSQGADGGDSGSIIQATGRLAAAMDFGQSRTHGGNGLEVISFFDDETISISLPKDIKDKEEIDIEGARGTITRMIIGAMMQGMSPVVTLKQKDYCFLEMIQGGSLNRETGAYNPPLSRDSDHPTFYAEIFSAVYNEGSSKMSDVAGYERILLRSMIGLEGDVPIEAKAWATYAYNLTATEYSASIDGKRVHLPAWEEQGITLEQFDALRVKHISMKAA